MRKFNAGKNIYKYEELQVKEENKENYFTLTQRETVLDEDTYSLHRYIAVENVNAETISEPMFYVYEFLYIENNCLCKVFVDQDTTKDIISNNILDFLTGGARKIIEESFKNCY